MSQLFSLICQLICGGAGPSRPDGPPYQQQCHVVVPLVAGIAADLLAEQVEEGFRVLTFTNGHAFGEREERPRFVSRLSETVGVKQDRVTGLPGNGEGLTLVSGEQAQAEGESTLGRSQKLWALLAEQQRPGVAAVEHCQLAGVLADLGQDCGDELLSAEFVAERCFDLARDRLELEFGVSG